MSYTQEQFIEAVKTSHSIAQVLKKLNLIPSGGNYKIAKNKILDLNLDDKHFLGQGHLKNKQHNWAKTTPKNKVFIKNYTGGITTANIKKRLLKEGIFIKKCYCCENISWNSQEIPLELEHINGDNKDNRIENLTLLCPNCHAQTKTYRGKNKKRKE